MADPTVATFHNRGRVYQRWPIVGRGDRCDWIAYADDVVVEALSRLGRRARGRDPEWFPAEFVPVSSQLYARQRRLFDRAATATDRWDREEVDEAALLLLADVLAIGGTEPPRPSARRRTVDAVQHVRALIASAPSASRSLRGLARAVEMSPFQLCRAFSAVSGETMTSYRLRLRLLASLERLHAGERLVDIALRHGFSSHSHFGAAFRAAFGIPPSAWRRRKVRAGR